MGWEWEGRHYKERNLDAKGTIVRVESGLRIMPLASAPCWNWGKWEIAEEEAEKWCGDSIRSSDPLATWFKELTHCKRPWCWERSKAGGEGDDRRWDSQMALLTQWTWIWASSGRWWRTEKPGMLQFMGSQWVGHDWATEGNNKTFCIFCSEHVHVYGNPLQCSCLDNPRDGGARWAAVYGVTQSRTRLKWLSSSSNVHVTTTRLWTLCVQPITRFWNRTTHKVKPLSCVLFFATPWTLGY